MNTDARIEAIVVRLEEVEQKYKSTSKTNRRLKIINVLLLSLILSLGLLGLQVTNPSYKVIETEKLVIKDKKGMQRIALFMDTTCAVSTASIKIYDEDGLEAIRLASGAASILQFKSENQTPFNCYLNRMNGAVGINFKGSDGTQNANQNLAIGITLPAYGPYLENINPQLNTAIPLFLNGDREHDVGMFIYNKDKMRYWMGYTSDTRNGLQINDSKNNTRLLWAFENGRTDFNMCDNIGKIRVELFNDDISSHIRLFDNKGNIRSSIGSQSTKDKYGRSEDHPESTIFLFDENGNSMFRAP